jgi:hypothetical protein
MMRASEAGIWVDQSAGLVTVLKWKWVVDRSQVIDKVTGQPVNFEFKATITDDVVSYVVTICARHRKATRSTKHWNMGDAQAQVYAWLDRNFKVVA